MTKAIFLDAHGGPEQFSERDFELPPPAAGELRVRHSFVGLNFIDIYQRKGLYPISLPAILGSEASGVVEAVGEGVNQFSPGDRIAYLATGGAYSEAANIPAVMAASIPKGVRDEEAAASFLKGLTVEMLVRQVFPLAAHHTCLIYAAAGGVGTLLCQWTHHIGARIIAVVGSEEKAEIAKTNGATDVILRTETTTLTDNVRTLTDGRGVDVVYDSVGAATFEASLNALALRGHMVTFGNASGPPPPVEPLALSRRGSLTLTRPTLFHYATPDRLPTMAAALFDLIAKDVVKPTVGRRYKLNDIAEAHKFLESGKSAGSIILQP